MFDESALMTEEIRYLIREHIDKMREIDYLLRNADLPESIRLRLKNERERLEWRTLLLMRKLDLAPTPS